MRNRSLCIRACILVSLLFLTPSRTPAQAQPGAPQPDLLLKGGHVIDPRNSIDAVMDVAVTGSKIALVATNIAPRRPGASPTPRASTSSPG